MTAKHFSKTNALLAGSLLALGTGMPLSAGADNNPFQMKTLSSGYQVAHEGQKRAADSHDHDKDDSDTHESGEKHRGEKAQGGDHDSKSSEGKCGATHMKENEGKCGGMK